MNHQSCHQVMRPGSVWGTQRFPRSPKNRGGGGLGLVQPLVMMMDHENFFRCIHNTHQSFFKIWPKITMWFVHHHHCPYHLGLLRLSFGGLISTTGLGMVMGWLRFRAQDQELLARQTGSWLDGWEKMDPAIQGLKILSFNPLFKHFLRILVQNPYYTSSHPIHGSRIGWMFFFWEWVWLSNFCWSFPFQLSNENKSGCLGYIGDAILPSDVGITISRYKDPYEPTRIRWKVSIRGLFFSWLNRIKESIFGHIVVTGGCSLTEWGDLLARSDRCSPSPRHDFVDFGFPHTRSNVEHMGWADKFLMEVAAPLHWNDIQWWVCAELKKMRGKVQSLLEELECEKSFYNEANMGRLPILVGDFFKMGL